MDETVVEDDYCHPNSKIEYCLENVLYQPAVAEENDEFIKLKDLFNSFLINSCFCGQSCITGSCSHGENYKYLNEYDVKEIILNENRVSKDIIYECSTKCNCCDCGNRVVQHGPRKDLLITSSKILPQQDGIITAKRIPKGGFICEYAGEILTRSEAMKRDQNHESIRVMNSKNGFGTKSLPNYIICLKERSLENCTIIMETFIDPTGVGNIGRYINHSCDPNCEIISVRIDCPIPKLAIFAKRDIEAMEELFFHYGEEFSNKTINNNQVQCLCNSKNCQKVLPELKY